MELSVKTIYDYTTIGEYCSAKEIYNEMVGIRNHSIFILAALCKARIIEGKRQDRARRKKGGVSVG